MLVLFPCDPGDNPNQTNKKKKYDKKSTKISTIADLSSLDQMQEKLFFPTTTATRISPTISTTTTTTTTMTAVKNNLQEKHSFPIGTTSSRLKTQWNSSRFLIVLRILVYLIQLMTIIFLILSSYAHYYVYNYINPYIASTIGIKKYWKVATVLYGMLAFGYLRQLMISIGLGVVPLRSYFATHNKKNQKSGKIAPFGYSFRNFFSRHLNSEYFRIRILIASIIQMGCMSYQAYMMSFHVIATDMSLLYTTSMFIYCFLFTATQQFIRDPFLRKILTIGWVVAIDFIACVLVPFLILEPFVMFFNLQYDESTDFIYSDTWYYEAIRAAQQLMITSVLGIFTKLCPFLLNYMTILAFEEALDYSSFMEFQTTSGLHPLTKQTVTNDSKIHHKTKPTKVQVLHHDLESKEKTQATRTTSLPNTYSDSIRNTLPDTHSNFSRNSLPNKDPMVQPNANPTIFQDPNEISAVDNEVNSSNQVFQPNESPHHKFQKKDSLSNMNNTSKYPYQPFNQSSCVFDDDDDDDDDDSRKYQSSCVGNDDDNARKYQSSCVGNDGDNGRKDLFSCVSNDDNARKDLFSCVSNDDNARTDLFSCVSNDDNARTDLFSCVSNDDNARKDLSCVYDDNDDDFSKNQKYIEDLNNTNKKKEIRKKKLKIQCTKILTCIHISIGTAVIIVSLFTTGIIFPGTDCHFDCYLRIYPWFVSDCTCMVQNVNCNRGGITSDTLGDALNLLNPNIHSLIISHCVNITMPKELRRFRHVLGIEFFNVSLVDWGEEAAITSEYFHDLRFLLLYNMNFTQIPKGLLSMEFPSSLTDLEILNTPLQNLPDEVEQIWSKLEILYIEHANLSFIPSPIRYFPNLQFLSVASNQKIMNVPDDLFVQLPSLVQVNLAGTGISEIPNTISDYSSLKFVELGSTNVSSLPTTFKNIEHQIYITADDAPLCSVNDFNILPFNLVCGKRKSKIGTIPDIQQKRPL